MPSRERWTDERVDRIIGQILRVGVFLATSLVAVGAAVYLARHGGTHPDYRVFRGEPGELRSVTGIAREAARGSGRGLVQLGLLVLVATPVARVAFSVVAFAVQRDRTFVAVTLAVLAALVFGLFGRPL